jgi:hypothetical protein
MVYFMPTRKNILDDIQEHIDNEERVLVTNSSKK